MSYREEIEDKLGKALVGKRIKRVQYMGKGDVDAMGWYNSPILIELEDSTLLFPMSDDEGNDGGALATTIEGLSTIGVVR